MYSPQINTGTPPLGQAGASTAKPFKFTPYSDKQVVFSTNPIREQRSEMVMNAQELLRKIEEFEVNSANNPLLKIIE